MREKDSEIFYRIMEGSSFSSLSEEEASTKRHCLPEDTQEPKSSLNPRQTEDVPHGERLLSGEEQLTLITESMSVSSADEEKLQLLNKNTELRRLNKELMKLNEDWDHIYRSTTAGLQQRVAVLENENSALKQLNGRLLLKVEHEQNKSEYYEHTLMQELKKNQHLQDYIRLLESRIHRTDTIKDWVLSTQNMPPIAEVQIPERNPKAPRSPSLDIHQKTRFSQKGGMEKHMDAIKEVQDLKEQLEAMRCQTKIYEADYKIEHKDHERMLQENKRLRRREGEMRQQMALLQEQLKVYEDDFHKERSDKQLLQRLLMKKSPAAKEPVLIHRCNNEQQRPLGEQRRSKEEHRETCVCPKHCENQEDQQYR